MRWFSSLAHCPSAAPRTGIASQMQIKKCMNFRPANLLEIPTFRHNRWSTMQESKASAGKLHQERGVLPSLVMYRQRR